MTALPRPGRLLTIAEYARLDEDDQHRWELQEGIMVMSPGATPLHMRASGRLFHLIESQLPANLCVFQEVDIDLELVPADQPGWSRRPDLVVVEQAEFDRVNRDGGLLRASQIRLVVEIISPGSRRLDQVIKRGEYADAKIPHYWIVDVDPPRVSLVVCHLAGEFGYQDGGSVTGEFTTTEPFPVRVNLDRLA